MMRRGREDPLKGIGRAVWYAAAALWSIYNIAYGVPTAHRNEPIPLAVNTVPTGFWVRFKLGVDVGV